MTRKHVGCINGEIILRRTEGCGCCDVTVRQADKQHKELVQVKRVYSNIELRRYINLSPLSYRFSRYRFSKPPCIDALCVGLREQMPQLFVRGGAAAVRPQLTSRMHRNLHLFLECSSPFRGATFKAARNRSFWRQWT